MPLVRIKQNGRKTEKMLTILILASVPTLTALGLHSAACGWHVQAVDNAGGVNGAFYRYAYIVSRPLAGLISWEA